MQKSKVEELILTAIDAAVKAGDAIMDVYASENFEISEKTDSSPLTLADRNAHEIIDKILNSTGYPIISEEGKDINYEVRKQWNTFWLVDPLDGTKEFIKRNGEFTVNIALINNKTPVIGVIYVPTEKTLYFGAENIGAYRIWNYESGIRNINNIIDLAERLPLTKDNNTLNVIASRSHMNQDTSEFIENLKKEYTNINIISKGSSLKLCLIAEGNADFYPRYGPCMEWDTAAGHAIILNAGGNIFIKDSDKQLEYNKESLLNPSFLAKNTHSKE